MPASIAASMIGTFRSYQELLITESHFFSSRTRDAASRASTETGTARLSRCAAAKAFAFASFLPPIPIRATPGEEIRDRGLGHGAVAADDQHVHGPSLSHGNDSVISPFRNGSGVGHPRRPEDRGTGEDEDDAACERGSVPEEAREGAAEEGAEDRSESLDRVEGTEGAGPSAFRGQAGDQCGAGDIDHGPARAHSRVEGDDEREARDGRESGETQQEEGSEKQGPSDGPV